MITTVLSLVLLASSSPATTPFIDLPPEKKREICMAWADAITDARKVETDLEDQLIAAYEAKTMSSRRFREDLRWYAENVDWRMQLERLWRENECLRHI